MEDKARSLLLTNVIIEAFFFLPQSNFVSIETPTAIGKAMARD